MNNGEETKYLGLYLQYFSSPTSPPPSAPSGGVDPEFWKEVFLTFLDLFHKFRESREGGGAPKAPPPEYANGVHLTALLYKIGNGQNPRLENFLAQSSSCWK